jgi:hypothetical protein
MVSLTAFDIGVPNEIDAWYQIEVAVSIHAFAQHRLSISFYSRVAYLVYSFVVRDPGDERLR